MYGAAGALRSTAEPMTEWQAPDTTQASLKGLCPRCGAPGLFRSAVSFSDRCGTCGLDFGQFNVGDGPAAFLIMIVGGLLTIGIVMTELAFAPPIWVHVLIWVPLLVVLTVGLLRLAKAALLILEFRNRAHEGRIVE